MSTAQAEEDSDTAPESGPKLLDVGEPMVATVVQSAQRPTIASRIVAEIRLWLESIGYGIRCFITGCNRTARDFDAYLMPLWLLMGSLVMLSTTLTIAWLTPEVLVAKGVWWCQGAGTAVLVTAFVWFIARGHAKLEDKQELETALADEERANGEVE